MIGQLRLYLPTDAGIVSATVQEAGAGGQVIASGITPQGTGYPAWSTSNLSTDIIISVTLASGVSVSQWVINQDGTVSYVQDSPSLYIRASAAAATNVQIRLETTGTVTTTYYANLSFDANGGAGAPGIVYGSSMDSTGYVQMTIPDTVPTRSGYAFVGWATNAAGTGTIRQPGGTYTGGGSTTYPGPSHTLYAVWTESSGGAYIWTGSSFVRASAYIWTGSRFERVTPYVWSGAWKKGN